MEITEIICAHCGKSFSPSFDSSGGDWWQECPKCGKRTELFGVVKPLLQKLAGDSGFEIYCGTLTAYHGCSSSLRLPESVSIIRGGLKNDGSHGYVSENEIRKGCFEDSGVEEVEFTGNIRVIGDYAFANCKHLKEAVLPAGLVRIGLGAFAHCDSLEYVEIPITCVWIDDWCFAGCKNLKTVRICNNASEYRYWGGEWPFATTRKCLHVGRGAFSNCVSLQSISRYDGEYAIPRQCFQGCTSLESFDIPSEVSFINELAFSGCESIRELHLPEDNGKEYLYLEDCCFNGMKSLRRINIPDNARLLTNVFAGCESLIDISVSDSVLSFNWEKFVCTPFYKKASLRLVEIAVPELGELRQIKNNCLPLFNERRALRQRLNNLGFFDMSEKRRLRSEISDLGRKIDELVSLGSKTDYFDLRWKVRDACHHYRVSFEDEFCRKSYNGLYIWYGFMDWYYDNRD